MHKISIYILLYIYISWVSDQTRQQCAIDGLILCMDRYHQRISKGQERAREKHTLAACTTHSLRVWNLEWPHTTYPRGHSKLPNFLKHAGHSKFGVFLFGKCGVILSSSPSLKKINIYISISIQYRFWRSWACSLIGILFPSSVYFKVSHVSLAGHSTGVEST